MKKHKSSWPFLDAVNREEVPDYYDIIKDPIDIKSIDKKLSQGQYLNKESFIKDVNRIFDNARQYNQPDTVYYRCADELEAYIDTFLESLKEDKEERKIPVNKKIKKKY